ncbi:MAG: glycerophosphoryl diester phosphodiesterase membrane domain-containing protein [Balneolaceae bacterium]|nr:glycerophosphoryl diester phosphodiesterase membrane domain-containing protein [Balneolaceae bacterium]
MQSFIHHKVRDIGDIITDSFLYIREHYQSLGKALLFFVLPLYIIQFFLLKGYTDQLLGNIQANNFDAIGSIFNGRYLLGIVVSVIASSTLTVVTLKHLQLTEHGYDATPEQILVDIVPNVLKYIGLYFLLSFMLGISIFFFVIPFFYFGVKFCLSFSALILEDETVTGSMRRSWELTANHWWSTFGVVLVMYFLMMLVSYAILLPISILSFLVIETGAATTGSSLLGNIFLVINGIFTAVASLLSTIIFIGIALQYYNLVERKEGGSLRSKIEDLVE